MSDAGIVIPVKVSAGASRDRVVGRYGDGIKVQVSAAPEKGRANAAVANVLAEFFGIKANQVELVTGPANPRKQFRICGLAPIDVEARIASL